MGKKTFLGQNSNCSFWEMKKMIGTTKKMETESRALYFIWKPKKGTKLQATQNETEI